MTRDRTRFQLSKKGGTRDFKGWYWYRQDSTQLSYFLYHAGYVIWYVVAGADLQLSGSVFQYRNRPFHPRSISPYARLERFACLSFLNRLTVSPVIHHNWKRTPPVSHLSPITGK